MSAPRDRLLTTREVARFVARGFLRFDALVPDEINRRFLESVERDGPPPGNPAGTPLDECYRGTPVRELLDLPRVRGIVESLVCPNPRFDHHGVHFNPPAAEREAKGRRVVSQHTHQDSTIDPRRSAFDVQLFYYPQEVTPEMGGTRYVPGSHLRVVSEASIGRYQNVRGQEKVVCPAGTLMVCHHGIWHGGEVNRSSAMRYMLKIRLGPRVPQVRLWNTDDLSDETLAPRPIFDPTYAAALDPDDVRTILMTPEPWFELDTGRLEFIQRIRLLRALLGDESADVDYWLTRIENEPR